MQQLGHSRIDLLKMDIEGAEYQVFEDLATDMPPIGQIAVEFHHWLPEHTDDQTHAALKTLQRQGFDVFAITDSGREYSLIAKGVK